jgi:competence protein ComEC
LLVTFGYLLISGAPVPTQRAFIMNAIVLLAVLLDRDAVSLRSITWAATAVLLMQPEALTGASFQLSFAAVYGLISGYEALGPRMAVWRQGAAWWATPLFYVGGILLTTQIAGSATAFYTLFHFNRYASYSLLGNFLAVPVVGFWVMPAALLAFCLMPFGLDGWGWQLMGWGVLCVNRIALLVSALPGATLNLPAMPVSAVVLFSLGGLWLCLWKTQWRLLGLAAMAAGILVYGLHRPPDILVDAGGRLMAVRGADGRLYLSPGRAAKSVRAVWIRQAGEGTEAPSWHDLAEMRCAAGGCWYRTHGQTVVLAAGDAPPPESCPPGDLLVLGEPAAAPCPSARRLIDGVDLARRGTHALWLGDDGGVTVQTVADWQGRRPWSHFLRDNEEPDDAAEP